MRLVTCLPSDPLFVLAATLLQNTWIKKTKYQLGKVLAVYRVENSRLTSIYEGYKAMISVNGVVNGNELMFFHGTPAAAMDPASPDSIIQTGFLKKYCKSSAGDWQRFGPGF